MQERLNNTTGEIRKSKSKQKSCAKGSKRIKTVVHDGDSIDRCDLAWPLNICENLSSGRVNRQPKVGPHYTLKASTKKKKKRNPLDFYDQDSRCSSSFGVQPIVTQEALETKNLSLVNISLKRPTLKIAGMDADGSVNSSFSHNPNL